MQQEHAPSSTAPTRVFAVVCALVFVLLSLLMDKEDPGFLPAAVILIFAFAIAGTSTTTANRLVGIGGLALCATGIFNMVKPVAPVFGDAERLVGVVVLTLGVVVVWRAYARSRVLSPTPWRATAVIVFSVVVVWQLSHGRVAWPCVRGGTSACAAWVDLELARGTTAIAKAVARAASGPGRTGLIFRVARETGDAAFAENLVGASCSRTDRAPCVSLGDVRRALGHWPEAIAWYDKACTPEPPAPGEAKSKCIPDDQFFPKLIAAERWPDVERTLQAQCTSSRGDDCARAVPMGVLDLAVAHDVDWGERTFTARCEEGAARFCFVRGALAERTRRGDPLPWYRRACELGDPDGCRNQ